LISNYKTPKPIFKNTATTLTVVWLNPELKTIIHKLSTIPTRLIFNPEEKLMQAENGQLFSEEIENLSKYVM
jgi:hypothetical protein